MKILISDKLSPKGIAIFEREPDIQVDVKTGLSHEELKSIISQYDGLVIRSGTKVTKEIIQEADNLKVIGRAGSGLDNVDVAAATKRGIVVMNTPGGNTITTAEHTVSMMLSLARHIPQATQSMKEGKWQKGKFMGTEIFNHILGIIGIGNIGSVVAERAKAFGMHVIAFDPYIAQDIAKRLGVELVSLDELYARSDFISIHTPKTDETKNMINANAFAKMKDGVRIINCARGGIINERDLADAIRSGKVAGAALDVYEKEPPEDKALIELENVICTPHLGASTIEAQENVAIAVAEQIVDYLVNGTIRNAANVHSVAPESFEIIKPYLDLAERMGKFQGQIIKGGLKQVNVEYSGEIANLDVEPVTVAILKGLLEPVLNKNINFVNAPHVAKERGINVVESKTSKATNFTQLITVRTQTDKGENIVEGTIFGLKDPRIVKIDQFELECIPEGHMLLIYNYDKPGVIGSIGKAVGDTEINIARMQVGREREKGTAIILLNTDTSVPREIVERISGLRNIISVQQLKV